MAHSMTTGQLEKEMARINALEATLRPEITTTDLAKLAGVGLSTFRRWESRGITPTRTGWFKKLYDEAETLAFLKRLKDDDVFRRSTGIYLPKPRRIMIRSEERRVGKEC